MKVKEYKGVNIYVHNSGVFYCNPTNNSNEFSKHLFKSEKLTSIEKAIDNYVMQDLEEVYIIFSYYDSPFELKAKRKLGNLIVFEDDTTNKMTNRRYCCKKGEVSQDIINKVTNICDKRREIDKQRAALDKESSALHSNLINILYPYKSK